MQVVKLHAVAVSDAQQTYPRADEMIGDDRPQRSTTHQTYASFKQLFLPFSAHLGHEHLTAITIKTVDPACVFHVHILPAHGLRRALF